VDVEGAAAAAPARKPIGARRQSSQERQEFVQFSVLLAVGFAALSFVSSCMRRQHRCRAPFPSLPLPSLLFPSLFLSLRLAHLFSPVRERGDCRRRCLCSAGVSRRFHPEFCGPRCRWPWQSWPQWYFHRPSSSSPLLLLFLPSLSSCPPSPSCPSFRGLRCFLAGGPRWV